MEAFAPALIACFLAELPGGSPRLAAVLGERYRAVLSVLAGLVAAQILMVGVSVCAGVLLAPTLNAQAQGAMLALSLTLAALAMARVAPLKRMEAWRTGAFLTAFLGQIRLGLSESAGFIAFALALQGNAAGAVAVGAAIGMIAPGFIAMALGERDWAWASSGWTRLTCAILLGGAAAMTALRASALI